MPDCYTCGIEFAPQDSNAPTNTHYCCDECEDSDEEE